MSKQISFARLNFLRKNLAGPKTISLIFSILVISFVISFYAFSWDEPTQPPPGGDVYPPVHTGSEAQIKEGPLYINGTGISDEPFRVINNDYYLFVGANRGGDGGDDYVDIGAFHSTAGWKNLVLNRDGGNVGIGETNPSAKLDIVGAAEINGQLDMTGNKIVNVLTPFDNTDAVNKDYVDAQMGSNVYGTLVSLQCSWVYWFTALNAVLTGSQSCTPPGVCSAGWENIGSGCSPSIIGAGSRGDSWVIAGYCERVCYKAP